jgi:hypothetical protein
MAQPDRDPLAATVRLLIDGNNVLHALSRTPTAAPPSALIGRLRAAIPAYIAIELIFDGPAERGLRGERIASGVTVRYSGARTADMLILALVDDTRKAGDADDTAAILIVTDDRELRYGARLRGARTAGTKWLLGRLGAGRLASPSVGNPRPMRSPKTPTATATTGRVDDPDPEGPDRPGWKPGRGATTKRGNPHKAPKAGGAGRMPP